MAGMYIQDIELPKAPGKYRIEFDSCGNPYLLSDNGDLGLWHLVPVPDHGRLVDIDALQYKFDYAPSADYTPRQISQLLEFEEIAPTIIPADRKEREA